MQRVFDFLKQCGAYYLATTDGDQPRVRPFGTIDWFEGNLNIQTGKSKGGSRQIAANPRIELCAFDGETWLRVEAIAVEDNRVEAQAHMLEAYPELRAMYAPGDGNTQIFCLTEATATFSSFQGRSETVRFG